MTFLSLSNVIWFGTQNSSAASGVIMTGLEASIAPAKYASHWIFRSCPRELQAFNNSLPDQSALWLQLCQLREANIEIIKASAFSSILAKIMNASLTVPYRVFNIFGYVECSFFRSVFVHRSNLGPLFSW